MDMNTQIGSQINEAQVKKIASYIEIAKQEGATIATGGEPIRKVTWRRAATSSLP